MTVFVGTSGWQYRDWRGPFYPQKLPQGQWLEFYAKRFQVVEVNNTFYRLPEKDVFVQWRKRTPSDFIVGVKVSRYLTHIKRLREPAESVGRLLERTTGLGRKIGPLLVQLPPNLQASPALLEDALSTFPRNLRIAVEFRHPSWFKDEIAEVLKNAGAAFVLADRESKRLGPVWRTADWTYLRMHEGTADPRPCYGRKALTSWAETLHEHWGPEGDAYIFFNNDPGCCAVRDSIEFARIASKMGLDCTRVPGAGEVSAG